ncbi:MAG: DUF4815 domain-containing protein [Gammaproteobacteria bacterium]|nr:DUF4815 domain-containing protein [Gammaproteobacteria bacterium]
MTISLDGYHDRFDPADNYDRWLFRDGSVLQSAELNEVQSASQSRLRSVMDALMRDGEVMSGADCVLETVDGVCTAQCASGAVYLRGAARGVAPRTFTIPAVGRISIGVYLVDTIITELDDPGLRDPSISPLNMQEPGAARLKVIGTWGYRGSGQSGDFYAVHDIEDGILLSHAPPPQVEAIAQSIARYDRQSSGGFYVSSGLKVTRLPDVDGKQVYSMADGVARVSGVEILRQFARRFEYAAVPDTRSVSLEAHQVSDDAALGDDFTTTLTYSPIRTITGVSVIRQTTHTWTRGAVSGTSDLLPHVPVTAIVSVVQGGTTYTPGVDYQLASDRVDWSLGGAEPSPGSSYTVTYQYTDTMTQADLDDVTETGFTVPGTITIEGLSGIFVDAELVPDTPTYTFYSWALPRIDRICMDIDGEISVVKGPSAPQRPRTPAVPTGLLGIALVEQRWGSGTRVVNNGVRMVAMDELNAINRQIETLFALVAEERLALNLTQRDATAKKGVFADPLIDDDFRDQGIEQTAAIFRGILTLGVEATIHPVSLDENQTLDARVVITLDETVGPDEVLLQQVLRTSAMRVNPYDSFSPLPGVAVLRPAIDYWTDFQTNWLSPVTRQFDETIWLNPMYSSRASGINTVSITESNSADVEKVGTRYVELQNLRPITVQFDLSGFGPGEILTDVRFDGVAVAFSGV